jgi:uncharacterized membrane protein
MSYLIRAGTIGACSGIRSLTPPAVVSWAASTGRLDLPPRLRFLSHPGVTSFLLLSALGEVVVDKLPFVPSRTVPPVLAWRVATGAFLGAALALAREESGIAGALVGGTGGACGSYGGAALRAALGRLSGLPEPFPGIVGDALAVTLSLWAASE